MKVYIDAVTADEWAADYDVSLELARTVSRISDTVNTVLTGAAVTVKINGTTLISGTDYTVSYSENTNAGTAKVTVTGKGSYSGGVTKTFTINAQTLSSSRVTLSYTSKICTGKSLTPSVTVKNSSGTKLTKGTYKIKVQITSAATTNYKKATRMVTLTVKVK